MPSSQNKLVTGHRFERFCLVLLLGALCICKAEDKNFDYPHLCDEVEETVGPLGLFPSCSTFCSEGELWSGPESFGTFLCQQFSVAGLCGALPEDLCSQLPGLFPECLPEECTPLPELQNETEAPSMSVAPSPSPTTSSVYPEECQAYEETSNGSSPKCSICPGDEVLASEEISTELAQLFGPEISCQLWSLTAACGVVPNGFCFLFEAIISSECGDVCIPLSEATLPESFDATSSPTVSAEPTVSPRPTETPTPEPTSLPTISDQPTVSYPGECQKNPQTSNGSFAPCLLCSDSNQVLASQELFEIGPDLAFTCQEWSIFGVCGFVPDNGSCDFLQTVLQLNCETICVPVSEANFDTVTATP